MLSSRTVCQVNFSELPISLIGEWQFKTRIQLRTDDSRISLPLARKMIIEYCNDSNEIKTFPNSIKKRRAVNILTNIRIREYDSLFQVLDTCYPVGKIIVESLRNDSLLSILNYCKSTKYFYHISKLCRDTMVIGLCDIYLKRQITDLK